MIIRVKKKRSPTLVISTQNWSILAKFAKKTPAKSAIFYWLFLGEVSPRNFPWNRPIFLRICPWKSFENWLFSDKIPRNGPIFLEFWLLSLENRPKSADYAVNFDFFPPKIPRNRPIFPRICTWKCREILLFFPRNIRSPEWYSRTLNSYQWRSEIKVYLGGSITAMLPVTCNFSCI